VDAIYRTGVDAGGVFRCDTGFGNDIGHLPLSEFTVCLPQGRFKLSRGEVDSWRMAPTIENLVPILKV
jgi:hypothetical protein